MEAVAPLSIAPPAPPSGRIVIVFTRFGSFADVGGGGMTSGAADAADGSGAVDRDGGGGTGNDTGCSSVGPSFVAVGPGAPMRSWNGLLSALCAGAGVAGTVFAGVMSALITGGLAEPPEPGDVKAR